MIISKSISISKKYITRSANISLGYQEVPNSGCLSELSVNSITKIINDLNQVITQSNRVITWGVDRCMVDSDHEGSLFTNINGIETADIATNVIRDLLIEIKNFKLQYEDVDNLKNIIGQAFSAIKLNPNNHKISSNSIYHYTITINNINIILVLEVNDFTLSSNEYVNQLNTNF
ncbi:hypothetical protein [Chryseobacterium sp. ERMR1:04]|uniref:hypothetical protein n=1 Tax=Chryseobacterium sp. ERMR1:04 TaxID=1705393 RepID=UPI0006C88731|nr:hypothetical protein [Chryseobacterium sp. ERMR1:04]KPH15143.1 hypothetical protein AMQ68_07040 [Chryseobacterium sp. ERMR1:04]